MRWKVMTATLIVLALGANVSANEPLPPPVLSGLQALENGKCREAFELWSSSWQSGDDAFKRQQLVSGCDFLTAMGTIRGYDIVDVVNVTPHLRRVYVLLRYERQPVYLLLVAYAPHEDQWKIVGVNYHTDPDKVFPATLFAPIPPHP